MTLQKLCLSTIATSIDRYYHAYSMPGSNNLKPGFQVLRKFYAMDLIHLLHTKGLLNETHADLLFNKHLNLMDVEWLSTFSSETIIGIFAEIGPNLKSVIFFDCSSGMEWVKEAICHLSNVKYISFESCCNDEVLGYIAEYCPKLEKLNIRFSYEVTMGLEYFYRNDNGKVPCPLLKEIYISCTSVTDKVIKHLVKNLPSLEITDYPRIPFILHGIHVDYQDVLEQARKYHLTYLNLLHFCRETDSQYFDEVLTACVKLCPNLKTFYCPIFKLEHANLCSELHEVEDLILDCKGIALELTDLLKQKSGKLLSLCLRNFDVSLPVLGLCCRRLRCLTLDLVRIHYNKEDTIPIGYNLREFTLENGDFSDSGLCKAICNILTFSPHLEILKLKKCKSFTAEVKCKILQMCKQDTLMHFDFTGSSLDKEFLESLFLTCSTFNVLVLDEYESELETYMEAFHEIL